MTAPEDFETRLAERMSAAGGSVDAEGVTLDGVVARHRDRMRAHRVRQGAMVVVVAGGLVATGVGLASVRGDAPAQVAAQGPVTEGPGDGATSEGVACDDGAEVVVHIRPSASEEQVREVGRRLEERFGDGVRFVDREEAYQEALALFADQPETQGLITLEVVPESFRISVAGEDLMSSLDEVKGIVAGLEVLSVVEVGPSAGSVPVDGGDSPVTATVPRDVIGGGRLTDEQIEALVAYIRSLQIDVTLSGEPRHDGCGDVGGADTTAPPDTAGPTSPEPPAGEDPLVTTVPGVSSDLGPDPATETTTPPPTAPVWPAVATPEHGGRIWAVYLAVEDDSEGWSAPDLRRAGDQARDLGYDPGTSELACDRGAAEALGLDPAGSYLALPLYFGTEAEARRFAEQFTAGGRGPVRGVAEVTTYCLD